MDITDPTTRDIVHTVGQLEAQVEKLKHDRDIMLHVLRRVVRYPKWTDHHAAAASALKRCGELVPPEEP